MKKFRPAQNIFWEGEKVPFFWGMAYYDWARDGVVYYLIPFNFVVRFCYWCMRKSHNPMTEEQFNQHIRIQNEIHRRVEHQRDRMYQQGFKDGWKKCGEHILDQMEKQSEDTAQH